MLVLKVDLLWDWNLRPRTNVELFMSLRRSDG